MILTYSFLVIGLKRFAMAVNISCDLVVAPMPMLDIGDLLKDSCAFSFLLSFLHSFPSTSLARSSLFLDIHSVCSSSFLFLHRTQGDPNEIIKVVSEVQSAIGNSQLQIQDKLASVCSFLPPFLTIFSVILHVSLGQSIHLI